MAVPRLSIASSVLLATCTCAVLAACGPRPQPQVPPTDGSPATTGTADTPAPDGPTGTPAPEPAKERTESSPIKQSAMIAEVSKLLGSSELPTLDKLKTGKKKKLMPLFQKALGYEDCGGCHAGNDGVFDYKKETKNLKMARNMWNRYVVELRDEKGGALFCDSCHDNDAQVLARADKDKVSAFMEKEYEGKLTRADGEEHSCSTCHTDVFEPHIFKDVWGIE